MRHENSSTSSQKGNANEANRCCGKHPHTYLGGTGTRSVVLSIILKFLCNILAIKSPVEF